MGLVCFFPLAFCQVFCKKLDRDCGRDPAARAAVGAADEEAGDPKGRRCPKDGRPSSFDMHRTRPGTQRLVLALSCRRGIDKKGGSETHLEVSVRPNDDHTYETAHTSDCARDCARSCSLGRTRHLCKLLLGKGRLRAARRTPGPDPSPTPPARTAQTARSAADAGY